MIKLPFCNVRVPLTRAEVAQLQAAIPRPPPLPPTHPRRRELAGKQVNVAAIYPCANGWSVPSDTGHGRYLVLLNDEDRRGPTDPWWDRFPQCSCPDSRIRHARCKHIAAVFRKLAPYEVTMGEATLDYQNIAGAAQEWS